MLQKDGHAHAVGPRAAAAADGEETGVEHREGSTPTNSNSASNYSAARVTSLLHSGLAQLRSIGEEFWTAARPDAFAPVRRYQTSIRTLDHPLTEHVIGLLLQAEKLRRDYDFEASFAVGSSSRRGGAAAARSGGGRGTSTSSSIMTMGRAAGSSRQWAFFAEAGLARRERGLAARSCATSSSVVVVQEVLQLARRSFGTGQVQLKCEGLVNWPDKIPGFLTGAGGETRWEVVVGDPSTSSTSTAGAGALENVVEAPAVPLADDAARADGAASPERYETPRNARTTDPSDAPGIIGTTGTEKATSSSARSSRRENEMKRSRIITQDAPPGLVRAMMFGATRTTSTTEGTTTGAPVAVGEQEKQLLAYEQHEWFLRELDFLSRKCGGLITNAGNRGAAGGLKVAVYVGESLGGYLSVSNKSAVPGGSSPSSTSTSKAGASQNPNGEATPLSQLLNGAPMNPDGVRLLLQEQVSAAARPEDPSRRRPASKQLPDVDHSALQEHLQNHAALVALLQFVFRTRGGAQLDVQLVSADVQLTYLYKCDVLIFLACDGGWERVREVLELRRAHNFGNTHGATPQLIFAVGGVCRDRGGDDTDLVYLRARALFSDFVDVDGCRIEKSPGKQRRSAGAKNQWSGVGAGAQPSSSTSTAAAMNGAAGATSPDKVGASISSPRSTSKATMKQPPPSSKRRSYNQRKKLVFLRLGHIVMNLRLGVRRRGRNLWTGHQAIEQRAKKAEAIVDSIQSWVAARQQEREETLARMTAERHARKQRRLGLTSLSIAAPSHALDLDVTDEEPEERNRRPLGVADAAATGTGGGLPKHPKSTSSVVVEAVEDHGSSSSSPKKTGNDHHDPRRREMLPARGQKSSKKSALYDTPDSNRTDFDSADEEHEAHTAHPLASRNISDRGTSRQGAQRDEAEDILLGRNFLVEKALRGRSDSSRPGNFHRTLSARAMRTLEKDRQRTDLELRKRVRGRPSSAGAAVEEHSSPSCSSKAKTTPPHCHSHSMLTARGGRAGVAEAVAVAGASAGSKARLMHPEVVRYPAKNIFGVEKESFDLPGRSSSTSSSSLPVARELSFRRDEEEEQLSDSEADESRAFGGPRGRGRGREAGDTSPTTSFGENEKPRPSFFERVLSPCKRRAGGTTTTTTRRSKQKDASAGTSSNKSSPCGKRNQKCQSGAEGEQEQDNGIAQHNQDRDVVLEQDHLEKDVNQDDHLVLHWLSAEDFVDILFFLIANPPKTLASRTTTSTDNEDDWLVLNAFAPDGGIKYSATTTQSRVAELDRAAGNAIGEAANEHVILHHPREARFLEEVLFPETHEKFLTTAHASRVSWGALKQRGECVREQLLELPAAHEDDQVAAPAPSASSRSSSNTTSTTAPDGGSATFSGGGIAALISTRTSATRRRNFASVVQNFLPIQWMPARSLQTVKFLGAELDGWLFSELQQTQTERKGGTVLGNTSPHHDHAKKPSGASRRGSRSARADGATANASHISNAALIQQRIMAQREALERDAEAKRLKGLLPDLLDGVLIHPLLSPYIALDSEGLKPRELLALGYTFYDADFSE